MLSNRQKRFVYEYLCDYDVKAAALRAGYTKATNADLVLARPEVQEYLQGEEEKLLSKSSAKAKQAHVQWINEICAIAFSDYDQFARVEGGRLRILDTGTRAPGLGRLIKKIKIAESDKGYSADIELHPKIPALELLGKYLGILVEKVEHSGDEMNPVKHEVFTPDDWARLLDVKTALSNQAM